MSVSKNGNAYEMIMHEKVIGWLRKILTELDHYVTPPYCAYAHFSINVGHLSSQGVKTLVHTVKSSVDLTNTELNLPQHIHNLTKRRSSMNHSLILSVFPFFIFIIFLLSTTNFDKNSIVVGIFIAHLGDKCQVISDRNLNQLILRLQKL